MARVRKQEEHTAKRKEILDTALQLIYSKGYDKMAIQDILDKLQISKGAFYHYFNSKAEVLEALVEQMATEQAAPILRSIVQDPHLTALEKLQRYFETSTRWKSSKKEFVMELVRVGYSDENALFHRKSLAKTLQYLGPIFTEIIKQGVQEGVFTTSYPEVASQLIINLFQSLADTSAKIMLSGETEHPDTLQRAKVLYAAYSDAMERLLGAPKGTLQLMGDEALKVWFSTEDAATRI